MQIYILYTENRLICASPKKKKNMVAAALLYPLPPPHTHTPMFIGMSYRLVRDVAGKGRGWY